MVRWSKKRDSDRPPFQPQPRAAVADDDFDVWDKPLEVSRTEESKPLSVEGDISASRTGNYSQHGEIFGWGERATSTERSVVAQPDSTSMNPSVLVVCTGNVCRSPYIERRLGHALADPSIVVSSAGTGALVGKPIDAGSVSLLEALSVPSGNFTARQLTEEMVASADLVLAATREHRREVVQMAPGGLRKTFTLHDFSDLVEGLDAEAVSRAQGDNIVQRLVAAAETRRGEVHPRVGEEADIVDPYRQGPDVFAQMQAQADPSIEIIVKGLAPQGSD